MQIRLTVTLAPRSGGQGGAAGAPSAGGACDVLVTAPSGTPLSAVTGGLVSTAAAAVSGAAGHQGAAGQGAAEPAEAATAVYAGTERLDPHRQLLGEPPLLDGAVVSLHGPALPAAAPALSAYGSAKARLHVVSGPDAGGIHLLQGGKVRLGRSAEADVPIDDPDVSRLHCAITVSDGGAVTVADLGSTNGTSLDGAPVGGQPVLFRPGSTLRVGESALRVETSAQDHFGAEEAPATGLPVVSLRTKPDGNGQLRLEPPEGQDGARGGGARSSRGGALAPGAVGGDGAHGYAPGGPFPAGGTTHGSGVVRHARYEEQQYADQKYAEQRTVGEAAGERPGSAEFGRPRSRGLGAWARRFSAGRPGGAQGERNQAHGQPFPGPADDPAAPGAAYGHPSAPGGPVVPATSQGEPRPDPATVLLTALGPGPRLWEREPGDPDALTVRIGSAHRGHGRPGAPVTVSLREAGSLGLAGPRPRLTGLARWALAQLAALHGPGAMELVLISADRSRESEERVAEWSWLGWLPHLRPAHGQDCRLLTAYDRDQATARVAELAHRLDESERPGSHAAVPAHGPYTLLVVDGDPGSASLRESVKRLAADGPRAGIHLLCLAETPPATPSSPFADTVRAACETSAPFRECGAVALLSGAVATAVRVVHREGGALGGRPGADAAGGEGTVPGAPGTVCTLDAVSAAWAERFARAMAPLRESESASSTTGAAARPAAALPRSARLLDELGLARATPAALLERWAGDGAPSGQPPGEGSGPSGRVRQGRGAPGPGHAAPVSGRATLVFGAGARGPLQAELGPAAGHALVTGPPGSGKTELLRSLAASLSVSSPPDRLRLLLLDGDGAAGDGLRTCLELPHARHHLAANDPVTMREFAQSISGELKRRAELIGAAGTYDRFASRHPGAAQPPTPRQLRGTPGASGTPGAPGDPVPAGEPATAGESSAEIGTEPGTLRLRTQPHPGTGGGTDERDEAATSGATGASVQHLEAQAAFLPRIVILVDDFDTLADPSLGNPGRPAAGSVMRALESVAKDGPRLGMHLVAASGRPESTAQTAVAQGAALRAELSRQASGDGADAESALPGRGVLTEADGTVRAFQAGRITGRIPRTATQRPTVVPMDWARAGDPPARRPVRELGNGPTDLALLASAVGRAAQSLGLDRQESGNAAANRSRSGQDEVLES